MARLDWDALRLTQDEAEVIATHHGIIESDVVHTMYARTDGWAAGLILMLERARQSGGSAQDVASVTREDLFSYFAGQLLREMPQEHVDLLALTALFPNFTLTQAAELTGSPEVGDVVEQLYSRQLFIDRRHILDPDAGTAGLNDQIVYQYHALFREFLLSEFTRQTPAAQRGEAMVRAGELLERAGAGSAAYSLYRSAQDWNRASACVKANAPVLSAQSRSRTLLEQIDALPPASVDGDVWLQYWRGMCLLGMNPVDARRSLDAAYRLAQRAEDAVAQVLAASGVVWTYSIEGIIAPQMADWVPILDRFASLEGQLPPPIEFVAQAGFHTAATWIQPDHPRLQASARRLLDLMDLEVDVNQKMVVATSLLHYFVLTGEIDLGRILLEKVDAEARRPEVAPMHLAAWLCARENQLGALDFHRHPEGLYQAIELAREHSLPPPLTIASSFLCTRHVLDRHLHDAQRLLTEIEKSHAPHRFIEAGLYHVTACIYHQAVGQFDLAVRHAQSAFDLASAIGGTVFRIMWGCLSAGAMAEAGDAARARAILQEVVTLRRGTPFGTYDALVALVEARLALRSGERLACHERLGAAIALMQAQPCQAAYARLMVLVFPNMLAEALRADIETSSVVGLIRRLKVQPPQDAPSTWPWPVRIRTLGRFQVEVDGKEIAFSTKSPKRLLQLLKELVAHGGRDVDSGVLIDQLWSESEGDKAVQAFTNALHRLRNLLQYPEALTLTESRLSLNPRVCWLDLWALEGVERLVKERGEGNGTEDLRIAAQLALDAYAGPFLPQEQAEFAPARRKHHAQFLRIATDLGARMERGAMWRDATEFWEKCLERDPVCEPFYLALMRCLKASGRIDEARNVFERAKAALIVQGRQPSRQLEDMRDT